MSKLELRAEIANARGLRHLVHVFVNGQGAGALIVDREHAAEVVRILNSGTAWRDVLEMLVMAATEHGCEKCGISRTVEVLPAAMDHAREVFAKWEPNDA